MIGFVAFLLSLAAPCLILGWADRGRRLSAAAEWRNLATRSANPAYCLAWAAYHDDLYHRWWRWPWARMPVESNPYPTGD